jgi:Glycosyl transferases group 1
LKKQAAPNRLDHESGRFTSVRPTQMPQLYRPANVFLHLATDEPFGNVFLEAMSCGLFDCWDSPRLRWIVGHEHFLTKNDNSATIASSIMAARNSSLRKTCKTREGRGFFLEEDCAQVPRISEGGYCFVAIPQRIADYLLNGKALLQSSKCEQEPPEAPTASTARSWERMPLPASVKRDGFPDKTSMLYRLYERIDPTVLPPQFASLVNEANNPVF